VVARRDGVRRLAGCRRLGPAHTGPQRDAPRGRALSGAAQSALLYDEDCSFCRWSLDRIVAWDRAKRLRPVPIQSEEGARLLAPMTREARLDSWHLVGADGRGFSAGGAAPPPPRPLPPGPRPRPPLAAFPGVTEGGYRLVAGHRDRLARLLHIDPNCQVRRRA